MGGDVAFSLVKRNPSFHGDAFSVYVHTRVEEQNACSMKRSPIVSRSHFDFILPFQSFVSGYSI